MALRDPASYPGSAGAIETIETHMSLVFLTRDLVFKLKKPIRTELFDHTTPEKRKRACYLEVRLNRRLAPSTYLDAVPVVRRGGRVLVDRTGVVIDWLVKMRRLPRHHMLDARIRRGLVEHRDLARLATLLGRFYQRAVPADWEPSEYLDRLAEDIEHKRASLADPRYRMPRHLIDHVGDRLRRWLDTESDALAARTRLIVDAHGDLRPEHVGLVEPWPQVIDCLEFSRELRLLDPVSELCFLSLECRRLGSSWLGEELIASYVEIRGETYSDALIRFYHAYHALVRGAVALWHLDDHDQGDFERWRARATEYLQIICAVLG